MNTSSEKVGELLCRLFSKGMSYEAMHFITDNDFKAHPERKEVFYKLFESGCCRDFSMYKELNHIFEARKQAVIDTFLDKSHLNSQCIQGFILPPPNPFDMFAFCSTLLSKSGAYHHIEYKIKGEKDNKPAERRGLKRIIKVEHDDIKKLKKIARTWRETKNLLEFCDLNVNDHFTSIQKYWCDILLHWHDPVHLTISEQSPPPGWWKPAYALFAIADEAAKNVGFKFYTERSDNNDNFSTKPSIWATLAKDTINFANKKKFHDSKNGVKHNDEDNKSSLFGYVESLSIADRSIVNVMPKARTAAVGYTLRGLTHNLASLPGRGTIRTGWGWTERKLDKNKRHIFNVLLIPYPYELHSTNFSPKAISPRDDVRFGKFMLSAESKGEDDEEFFKYVEELIEVADKRTHGTHAVVFPEMALNGHSVNKLTENIANKFPNIELLCSGVRSHPDKKIGSGEIPINGAYMATFSRKDGADNKTSRVNHRLLHEKHHPWKLSEDQILRYNLSASLDPSRKWIEDLHIVNRRIPFLVMRETWAVTTLICEDLARNDPARPIVESIGPNLIISLLMDGPQIPSRWSAKYANVLAEDPGSSVLSITSLGLIDRSNKIINEDKHTGFDIGYKEELVETRAFALWRDDKQTKVIHLEDEADAVLISLSEYPVTDMTNDGRVDNRSVALRLTGIRQIQLNLSKEERMKRFKDGRWYPSWGQGTNVS